MRTNEDPTVLTDDEQAEHRRLKAKDPFALSYSDVATVESLKTKFAVRGMGRVGGDWLRRLTPELYAELVKSGEMVVEVVHDSGRPPRKRLVVELPDDFEEWDDEDFADLDRFAKVDPGDEDEYPEF